MAAQLTLAWDPVDDTRVGGYELQYGTASRAYNTKIDVGSSTSKVVATLDPETTYYFSVRAYSHDRTLWSDLSAEVNGSPPSDPDSIRPTIISVSPANGATNVPISSVTTVKFSEPMSPSSIGASSFVLRDGTGQTVAAGVSYDSATSTATLKPSSSLHHETVYTAGVAGGSNGAQDLAGNTLAQSISWSFKTASKPAGVCATPCSLWDDTAKPGILADSDSSAVELGVKFKSDVDGFVTGVRFYKSTQNTGTHKGSLWSAAGQLLARATFTNETASGWQHVLFDSPVQIAANTIYVVSYHTSVGHYSADIGYFGNSRTNGPLTAPADGQSGANGVYRYGSGGFPTNTWQSANYWVDVLFTTGGSNDNTPPPVAGFTAGKTKGTAPLTVLFTDNSTGAIDTYAWELGDGSTSTATEVVHTYSDEGSYTVSLKVTGPGGEATETKPNLIQVVPPPPTAAFTPSATSGTAPLTVQFANSSSGKITEQTWTFGDGGGSTATSPDYTFEQPGDYTVTLVAAGPGGSDSETATIHVAAPTELALEVGDITIDHEWTQVFFKREFKDPVVVVGPLGSNGSDPAVVRVKGIDQTGFWVRVQEWDYLDGWHTKESVSYLAIERGTHELPNGTWIEAGTAAVDTRVSTISFTAAFTDTPVVITTVTDVNEADAVTTRLRDINKTSFRIRLQEQEVNVQAHAAEPVDYIAWEPTAGEINGLRYEAGRTEDAVTHSPYRTTYGSRFSQAPSLLADMQTTDGGDTAAIRWVRNSEGDLDLRVDEERSRDTETAHTSEVIGWIAIARATNPELDPQESVSAGLP